MVKLQKQRYLELNAQNKQAFERISGTFDAQSFRLFY
jgi:hypothetical protein